MVMITEADIKSITAFVVIMVKIMPVKNAAKDSIIKVKNAMYNNTNVNFKSLIVLSISQNQLHAYWICPVITI